MTTSRRHYYLQKGQAFITVVILNSFIALQAQGFFKDSTSYISSYFSNGGKLVAKPFKWKKEDLIMAGGSVALVANMITLDEAINSLTAQWQSQEGKTFGNVGSAMGSISFQGGISSTAILIGAISKNDKLRNFGLDNMQSQLYAGIIAMAIKNIAHRSRPYEGQGAFKWYGPFAGFGKESFYSGHTTLAFSTANMIFLYSGKKWWVGTLVFAGAASTALARMQQQKHWSSDVVMGAIMGTAVSSFVYRQQQKRRTLKAQKNSSIQHLP